MKAQRSENANEAEAPHPDEKTNVRTPKLGDKPAAEISDD